MVDLSPATPLLLLLPVALAGGVNLFLTILVVLLSLEPGWAVGGSGPQEALRWSVYGVLAVLYLVEVWMELKPLPALLWHTVQRLIRPLGVILLAWVILEDLPLRILLAGAILGGLVGAFTHALSWGIKLRGFILPRRRVSPLTTGMAQDTLTLAFLVLSLEFPLPGTLTAVGILLLGLLGGTSFLSVTRLGYSLFRERVWGIMSPPGWHSTPTLPPWVRKTGETRGLEGPRGLPALATGLPKLGGYRMGWLLEMGGARFFAFPGLGGARVISLAGMRPGPQEASDIHLYLPLQSREGPDSALFLQKTAPVPESHKW